MRTRLLTLIILFALVITSCTKLPTAINLGNGADKQETQVKDNRIEEASTEVPQDILGGTLPQDTGLKISNISDVKKGTVYIRSQGSFVDPEVGERLNTAGAGSGFIIDESGIAITNNHVVTGAALIKVYVGGETNPRNARVLGVSECWDLAVIDIEGDGFYYFDFYEGATDPGLEVYSAGYPLGDPEFTLTKGIISKANADGDTSWASVSSVLEHDAKILRGNSGGPLVTANGQVVGINYAGIDQYDKNYAINATKSLTVIETLKAGSDFESLGINGIAVNTNEGLSGIWVASVKSGSPADITGIQGGDIVTKLEGLVLATDGTMSSYCDILRTRSASETLSVEILRFNTEEVLKGQINGRELELSYSFAQELPRDVIPESSGQTTETFDYVNVMDDTQTIQMSVPSYWNDIYGGRWVSGDRVVGVGITASADANAFNTSYAEPGVFYGATNDFAHFGSYLDFLNSEKDTIELSCTWADRYEYQDSVFTGYFDIFTECGTAKSTFVLLVAVPSANPNAYFVTVNVIAINDVDFDTLQMIVDTFDVVKALP